jgi:DNA-binding GntR family transcriptional regulator
MEPASEATDFVDDRVAIYLKERSDSLVGRIAADVARAITEGRLVPGADLNSVELAARFGTSRTPVREALMLLEKEGLVEIPPRRRPRVSRVSLEEIEELYQIRVVLNGLMIASFVRNADEEHIRQMDGLYEQIRRHAHMDADAFQASRRALHNHWLDNCGNNSLRDLLSTWKMRMSVGRLARLRAEDVERSLRDHDRLVMACQDRDETLAVALMQSMTLAGLAAIKRQHNERN